MASRVSAIYWGTRFQNTLNLGYPLGDVITDREPRQGSDWTQATTGPEDAWMNGFDYTLECNARFLPALPNFDGGQAPNPLQSAVSSPAGVQAFLDWARGKNAFRFVPDITQPKFWMDGCYLAEPMSGGRTISPRLDFMQRLKIRNPTVDFALALRGLFLEYGPGSSLIDPVPYTVTRPAAYRITQTASLVLEAANVVRDRHYIGGVRTTLFERSTSNWCLQSQSLDNATSWTKTATTISADAVAAPDGTSTADRMVETAVTSVHEAVTTPNISITAGEYIAASVYVKAGERTKVAIYVRNIDYIEWKIDLTTGTTIGTTVSNVGGGGVLLNNNIVPLTNGWFRLEMACRVNTSDTAVNFTLRLLDASGAVSYLGDVTKGAYWWGAQFERFGTTIQGYPSSYIPTTTLKADRASDVVQMTGAWPWETQPLWIYAKMIDLGWSRIAEFGELVKWSNSAINVPTLRLFTGSGTVGSTPNHRLNYANGLPGVAGANQDAAQVTPGASPYDTVELFCRWFANGSTEVQRSINGGAVVTATSAGGNAQPDAFDIASYNLLGIVFWMTVNTQIGLINLKIGPGTTITTLAQAGAA